MKRRFRVGHLDGAGVAHGSPAGSIRCLSPALLWSSWSGPGGSGERAEQALAHAVGSQVEQCYDRSDVLERRREVMES